MSKNIYLLFLIVYGILPEAIIATLSDKDTRESFDFLVRKKRVINHSPRGLVATPIEEAKYTVNIQKNKGAHCAGAILSQYTVITSAPCVSMPILNYRVLSSARYENRGHIHNVTSKNVYNGNSPHNFLDAIALLTVDPPFVYGMRSGHINLYVGPLATGTRVTVYGWGCSYPPKPGPTLRRALRTITLPIMDHEECKYVYRSRFAVTEKHICTYDEEKYCARTDAGAPLVFDHKLVGIFILKGESSDRKNPDIFVDLRRPEYSEWIREHTHYV